MFRFLLPAFVLLILLGAVAGWILLLLPREREEDQMESDPPVPLPGDVPPRGESSNAVEPVRLPVGKFSVEERVDQLREAVEPRVVGSFEELGIGYPPSDVLLLGLKEEKQLEVHVREGASAHWRHWKTYPILAASGGAGPKLREGDLQVPEGVYDIELLNPNSKFHLSLRVGYPNEADLAVAEARNADPSGLGGDIMIHGRAVSVGCLAIGDPAIEELFFLAAETDFRKWKVLLAPFDFRKKAPPETVEGWIQERYRMLAAEMSGLFAEPTGGVVER